MIVAADTGGTFTDIVGVGSDGKLKAIKVRSTPSDPGDAVIRGIGQLCQLAGFGPENVERLLHGTTVATNSVLERRGANTALITTKGFRDVLLIGRQSRPRLFSLDARRTPPLLRRSQIFEIDERTDADGNVIQRPSAADIGTLADRFKEQGVEAVAVSLLHSYANAENELFVLAELRSRLPELYISVSTEVSMEYREYERTSTVAVNSFVGPKMAAYLSKMEARLSENHAGLQVMQSNGGLMSSGDAVRTPASTVLSGIAAGALGGVGITARAGRDRVLTLDMGGTSCDLALGLAGAVRATRSTEIGGLPVRLPSLDVHTLGAGGGSVAFVDQGGALQVGPISAGAEPGPACYGFGGEKPTVTDANVVLGRLPVLETLSGGIQLDQAAAHRAVNSVARLMRLSVEEAAEGPSGSSTPIWHAKCA